MMAEKSVSSNRWIFIAGLLLSLPAAVYLFVSMAKYALGWNGVYDALYPFYLRWGVEEHLGWNINLLIVFGPIIALFMNLPVFAKAGYKAKERELAFSISLKEHWPNVLFAAANSFLLVVLFTYLAGENCNCH